MGRGEQHRTIPRTIECPTCHAPVSIVDTLCYRCGDLIAREAVETALD